ncbi:MAG: metallophosphoesterase [Fibrobacteria bacterium]|nr:metallophosphoesterase [Fibrobacteria bacterium]
MNRIFTLSRLVVLMLSLFLSIGTSQTINFNLPCYLQSVTRTSALVSWEWTGPFESRLVYGNAEQYGDTVFCKKNIRNDIRLTDLKPGTRYYYNILVDDKLMLNPREEFSFFTAPGDKRENMVFAIIGDTRSGEESFQSDHEDVISAITQYTMPSFLLHTGDLVDVTEQEAWRAFFKIESPLMRQCPIYPVRGNSDGNREHFSSLFEIHGKDGWNAFSYGAVYTIILNISDRKPESYFQKTIGPDTKQYLWLKAELQSNARREHPFTVVMLFPPVFRPGEDVNPFLTGTLRPLFEKHQVDLVIGGSEHYFSFATENGVNYIVSGGGGASLNPPEAIKTKQVKFMQPAFHHVRATVHYPALTLEAVDNNGTVFFSHDVISRQARQQMPPNVSGERTITLFGSKECPDCQKLKQQVIPQVLEMFTGQGITFEFRDIDEDDAYQQYLGLETMSGGKKHSFPVVAIGKKLLSGEEITVLNLEVEIQKLQHVQQYEPEKSKSPMPVLLSIVVLLLIGAGIIFIYKSQRKKG